MYTTFLLNAVFYQHLENGILRSFNAQYCKCTLHAPLPEFQGINVMHWFVILIYVAYDMSWWTTVEKTHLIV